MRVLAAAATPQGGGNGSGLRSKACCAHPADASGLTAPPVIRVGSLSGVAATLLCLGEWEAGSAVLHLGKKKETAGRLSLETLFLLVD